jgi:hypothetical protein
VLLLADGAGYAATGAVDALNVFRDAAGAPSLYGGAIPLRHLGTDRPATLQILVRRSGSCWVGAVVVTDAALGSPRVANLSCQDFAQETSPDHIQGTAGAGTAVPLLYSFGDGT